MMRSMPRLAAVLLLAGAPVALGASRDLIRVEFKEINPKGYPVLTMINETGKEIDDIRGGFVIEDRDGTVLFSTGHTEAIPGHPFLAAGAKREMVPYGLNRKEELMARLRTEPGSLRFYFEARSVTYMDGTRDPAAAD